MKMVERKQEGKDEVVQTTLDRFVFTEDMDSDYGHLVSHLIEHDAPRKDTDQWTRVFSRDEEKGMMLPLHLIGPDLIFDKSMRQALSESNEL